MQLSIAGRYLVYVPQGEGVGVSRRLDDKERDRLRRAAGKAELGEGGVIVRTAAQGATREDFEREIKYLHKLHDVLQKRGEETGGAGHGLPGGRPVGARGARHLLGRVREGDRRRRASSTTGSSRSSTAPRRSCSSGSSSTRTTSRCSSATTSRRRSSRCCGAAWTCRAAAT